MLTLRELYLQILLGYQFLIALWFLFSTIIISILFVLISSAFKNLYTYIIQILGILIIFVQYLKLDNYFFNFKTKIQTPLNNTLSQIPLAASGFSFALYKFISFIKYYKYSKFISFIQFIIVYLIFKFDVFTRMRTFNGIENIFISYLLFIGFYFLPLENINTKSM